MGLFGKTAFPTWKTVTLGSYKSSESLLEAIKERGFTLGRDAEYMVNPKGLSSHFYVSPTIIELELVACKLSQLGLKNGGTPTEVIQLAKKFKLYPCPPELPRRANSESGT